MPSMYFWVLYKNRQLLAHPHEAPVKVPGLLEDEEVMRKYKRKLSRLGALFAPYEYQLWWFEFVTLLRKLLLTGGLVMVSEGTSARLSLGLLICFTYLMFSANLQPFYEAYDDLLSQLASILLFLTLLCGVLLKLDLSGVHDDTEIKVMDATLLFLNTSIIVTGVVILLMAIPVVRRRIEARVNRFFQLKKKEAKEKWDTAEAKELLLNPVLFRQATDSTDVANNGKIETEGDEVASTIRQRNLAASDVDAVQGIFY